MSAVTRRRSGVIGVVAGLALSVVLGACTGAASPSTSAGASPSSVASANPAASAVPSAAGSPSAGASAAASANGSPADGSSPSPSATALPTCLDKATYALLTKLSPIDLQKNAPALIAGLTAWAPPKEFDAQHRDKVVAALMASNWPQAAQLIGSIYSGQWQVKSC